MLDLKMWYESPAKEWTEALPLGNGHMGAMAYGGTDGLFDLSEQTCWSGGPQEEYLGDHASDFMRDAREALLAGNIAQAESLLQRCTGIKENFGSQVPFGRLWLSVLKEPDQQKRELDLRTGVTRDELDFKTMAVVRESFISNPDKVMAVRLTTNAPCLPDVRLWFEGWSQPSYTEHHGFELIVTGRALENMHSDGLHGVSYRGHLRFVTNGRVEWSRKGLIVTGATQLVVYLTCCTDMFSSDMEALCLQRIEAAVEKGWEKLIADHCAAHAAWMDRCDLDLPAGPSTNLPTNVRLMKYKEDKTDYALIALFFQYGRYLLLNSSWPDSLLPAALQGIWNDDRACRMGWTDDMHLDINTQMNYFPAETTGLGDCGQPLFRWIEQALVPQGSRIARELYDSDGWVAHTVSNAYGWAAPGWGGWGFHVSGGAWVATHLWEHYLFTRDEAFLRRILPILQGTAQFLSNILAPHPSTGELLVVPSYSPENGYEYRGEQHNITAGATVDTLITRYIFNAVIQAHQLLGIEDDLSNKLKDEIGKLPPFRVGKHGQLMEWYEDFDEPFPDHRHTSHLLSLYPFGFIDPDDTPELTEAVKVSIERRLGENATDIVLANWAGALLILYSARLLDGDAAGRFLEPMMAFLSRDNMMITHEGPTSSITGGIYELDGNTGFTAGVVEMLLHSHRDELHVLPAIPTDWKSGGFRGLRGRSGHEVSAKWEDGLPVLVSVKAGCDGEVKLRYQRCSLVRSFEQGQVRNFSYANGTLIEV